MTGRLEKITVYKGEELPIEADFRAKCKRVGSNITSAAHSSSSGVVTIGSSSLASNIATVVITGASKGCAIITSTGTTAEGYELIGKCEVEVLDPSSCK